MVLISGEKRDFFVSLRNDKKKILLLLFFWNVHSVIRLEEFLIGIISYKYRLQMIDPIIEIYIIFDGYFFQIDCFCCDEERETKIPSYIFSMSPNSEYPKDESDKKSHEPDMMRFCDDEEVDIGILACCEHRERISDGDHLDSRNPREFAYIFLCALKKENLMLIRFGFHFHESIEFLLVLLHTI
jgi:hypothetical protein